MSRKTTSRKPAGAKPPRAPGSTTDWAAFDALTDEDIAAAVASDPDAAPLETSDAQTGRRVGLQGAIRFRVGLGMQKFSETYHIPMDVLRGWERGTIVPDSVALAYLELIDADPEGVAATLAGKAPRAAAE